MSKRLTIKDGLSYPVEEYIVTLSDITLWFDIINDEMFSNGLDKFMKIDICEELGDDDGPFWAAAGCWVYNDTQLPMGSTLEIVTVFPCFQMFLCTLAHEMVHLFQWQELGISDHGPTFEAWSETFLKCGLPLDEIM